MIERKRQGQGRPSRIYVKNFILPPLPPAAAPEPEPPQPPEDGQTSSFGKSVPAQETVQRFPLSELHPFKGYPFKVLDDDAMAETVESIRMVGIANPLIVRPDPDGGYEIISGHRRHHAAELAGLDAMEESDAAQQTSAKGKRGGH